MKFARWKIIVVGFVILALSSPELFARGPGGGARGGEGGGGAARGGAGGARGGAGGARGGAGGGAGEGREGGQRGGAGGGEGRGGAGAGTQRGGGSGGGNANHSPSFSNAGGGGGRGAGEGAGNRSNSATGAANRKNPNSQSANQTGTGTGNSAPSGNTINTGNTINAASTGYHPNGANHGAYNGSWNDHGAYGAAAYAARPAAWGMESRDMAAMAYGCGYAAYSNPYAGAAGGGGGGGGGVSPVTNVYNYAQPVPPASNAVAAGANNAAANPTAIADATPASPPAPGQDPLDPAIAAFKDNDYDQALDLVNKAIANAPHDAVMHEFRGLVLFAKPDYQQAAATIHATLALGPGWDWTTLSSMYSNIDRYTEQLRALEKYIREHSQDGAAHFLLAYHYLVAGHSEVAAQQLAQVVKLVPGDNLAAQMLKMVSSPSDQPAPPTPDADQPAAKRVDPMMLVGNWKATREGDAKFELALTPDATFNWKFTQQGKTTEFGGKYSVDGNVLNLERSDGGQLLAATNFDGARKFNFKLVGAPESDPGLTFGR